MISKIKSFFKVKNKYINQIPEIHSFISNDRKSSKVNLGQIQARMNAQLQHVKSLSEVEFQVFSQWGDDGIIQYLVDKTGVVNKTFIEFGVENYKESNTRFLLINNNYSGLVIDGDPGNVEFIKNDEVFWLYDLHARAVFITKENINQVFTDFLNQGYDPEIGILSVDIDGNDYWVWKAVEVVKPVIVIVEYNAIFGSENAWTIPYQSDFNGFNSNANRYYWGVSLNALCHLAEEKGYSFVGCNSNGNNSYFIRNDKMGSLKKLTAAEGFVDSKFKLANDGLNLNSKRLETLKGREIFDVKQNKLVTI